MPPPVPDATLRAEPPADGDRLPMAATVGFVGHRSFDDEAAARAAMDQGFAEIGRAFAFVAGSPIAEAYEGMARLRLLIGAAPGADRLAAAAWRDAGLGEIHLIFPFRDPGSADAWTDRPERGDAETRVETTPEFGPWTGIDSISLGLGGDHAHAEVARWVVRHADLLLAWWDGLPSRGAGGTADTIERALARGVPVVWLQPGGPAARLIDPALAHVHADAAEALADVAAIARPLSAEALAPLLSAALAPPDAPGDAASPDAAARRDYAAVDPLKPRTPTLAPVQRLLDRTLWTAFKRFERIAGGRQLGPEAGPPPPLPLAVAAQPGFARLRAASAEASVRADHLGAIHRSEQLLLINLAILAVVVGASPALSPPGRVEETAHAIAAAIELALGLTALAITAAARRAHRHRRWSDARALAERFRGACATWPLGVDIADANAGPAQSWTEWRARAVLRATGPRRGWIDRPRFDESARWSVAQLLDSQIAYHARQHRLAEHIEANIQRTEAGAFGLLMVTLAAYLAAAWTAPLTGWRPPHWVAGVVTVVSAVTPAIGGGCLALAATNGFGETALRSQRLEAAFRQLKDELGDSDAYHHIQAVLRRGAQLLADDADAWRDRLQRRRLVRGG
jgi:hypothetical protein